MLILGIDPSPTEIPSLYKTEGVLDVLGWGTDIMSQSVDYIGGVKFQSAYFESYGLRGLQALATLIAVAKEHGLQVIMDAKRGDIGATSLAYATAYLGKKNNAGTTEFSCDYLTVNPLMGDDCLQPFVDVAVEHNKGIFVLLETSNPGAEMILKQPLANGNTVSQTIADYIQAEHDKLNILDGTFGPIGVVVGATNPNVAQWRALLPHSIFLMPGIGAQGGAWDAVKDCLNANGEGVMVPISRGITSVAQPVQSKLEYLDHVEQNAKKMEDQFKQAL
jgi:orotidine-5'-phosphate decarboxylase